VSAISKISPWTAKPLSDAAKNAKFRAVMDLAAERVILGRSAIVTGWAIGGVGVACFAASIFGWVTLLPLKTSEVKFFLVDKSTGIIGEPVGLRDAPRIFGAAVEQQYLKRYIEAREGWVSEMDERNDHVTKLMSTPDEQARYAAARNMPLSPSGVVLNLIFKGGGRPALHAVSAAGHRTRDDLGHDPHPVESGAQGAGPRFRRSDAGSGNPGLRREARRA
jgi:hypothetical protein